MESFKFLSELIGDLWLFLTSIALLAYHSIKLHFRVSTLENNQKKITEEIKEDRVVQGEKLDRVHERVDSIYKLLTELKRDREL